MRAAHLLVPCLLPLASCTTDRGAEEAVESQLPVRPVVISASLAGGERDLLDFNILQRTCALYVALRSSAWEGPVPFGREMDDNMVHWNMCPGGTMVACVATPTANGDTVITGIPWPYPPVIRH